MFRTNKQGYRNDYDFSYEKRDPLLRVLVLGDSHTQGFEVDQDQAYAHVLQQRLSSFGLDTEVMNVGISGFSTAESLVYLEQEGVRYKPDFVVLGFFANDYEDNLKAGLYKLTETGALEVQRKSHVPGVRVQDAIYSLPFTKWLGENSYAYSIAFNAVWDFAKRALSEKAREDVTEYAVATKSTHGSYELDLTAALIERIQEVSSSAGANFILVDIPQKGPNGEVLPSIHPQLAARLSKRPNHTVDVASLLAGTPLEQQSHLPRGHQHISASTHLAIANELAKMISADRDLKR
jgi:lysophospholipase L1-like esterase